MLGQHSLIGGFDYFNDPGIDQRRFQNSLSTIDTSALAALLAGFGVPFPASLTQEAHTQIGYQSPQWSYSFYLLDYWRPFKDLVVELGLSQRLQQGGAAFFSGKYLQFLLEPALWG